jgi:3-oxoacyl-[acyl-carrier protein] reductase
VDLGIRGKVALITGASEGLGLAAARALAGEGAEIAIAARRPDRLKAAAEEICAATGAEVLALPADAADPEQAGNLVSEVSARLGPVEILVANVGGPRPGRFGDFAWNDWVEAFAAIVGPLHHLVSAALPAMKESLWGRIVSIQSVSVRQPVDSLILSNSIRPAAAALVKALAAELAPSGITVNVVGPGPARTGRILELGRFRSPEADDDELARTLGDGLPIRRLVEPDEVAAAIAYLCSAQAAAITGMYFPVDGGTIRGQM